MNEKKYRILIISPVRDEAEYLQGTIDSIIKQSVAPVEWVVVDDGSTDETPELIKNAAQKYSWIHLIQKPDRGERAVGPGVIEAFYYGFDRKETDEYDYICKMDGDIEFPETYFESLLEYFEKDRYLGAASGKPFGESKNGVLVEERHSDEMVAGMINFYRRECFEDIGGFIRQVHWDGITFHKARMAGWRTRSIRSPKLNFIHKRQMGSSHKGIYTGRLRWGKGQYFMGTSPLYIFAIATYRMIEKPYIIGGLYIAVGYFAAFLKRMKRFNDKDFRKSLRAWQLERIKLGKRLEKIPEPEQGLY